MSAHQYGWLLPDDRTWGGSNWIHPIDKQGYWNITTYSSRRKCVRKSTMNTRSRSRSRPSAIYLSGILYVVFCVSCFSLITVLQRHISFHYYDIAWTWVVHWRSFRSYGSYRLAYTEPSQWPICVCCGSCRGRGGCNRACQAACGTKEVLEEFVWQGLGVSAVIIKSGLYIYIDCLVHAS